MSWFGDNDPRQTILCAAKDAQDTNNFTDAQMATILVDVLKYFTDSIGDGVER